MLFRSIRVGLIDRRVLEIEKADVYHSVPQRRDELALLANREQLVVENWDGREFSCRAHFLTFNSVQQIRRSNPTEDLAYQLRPLSGLYAAY